MPPQTPTGRLARMRAADGVRDQMQHGGIQAVDLRREFRMAAIHGERVLREIVGADGEEVRFVRELRRHHGGRRHFHHDAGGNRRDAEPLRFFREDGFRIAQFLQRWRSSGT